MFGLDHNDQVVQPLVKFTGNFFESEANLLLSEGTLLKFRVSDHVRKDDSFRQLANFQSGENGKK